MKKEFNVSQQIKESLSRSNVQVHSLASMDDALKYEYTTGKKKAMVIYRSKVYERKVTFASHDLFVIIDDELNNHLKMGDSLVVVFGTGGKSRMVVQVSVAKKFADRFGVKIKDPRHDKRYPVPRFKDLRYWLMPLDVILKLQEGEYLMERELSGPITATPDDLQAENHDQSVVLDTIMDGTTLELATNFTKAISESTQIVQSLVDVSVGGFCLKIPSGNGEKLINKLIYSSYTLMASSQEAGGIYGAGLKVDAFSVVRSCIPVSDGDKLNCMFLVHLSKMVENFFSS